MRNRSYPPSTRLSQLAKRVSSLLTESKNASAFQGHSWDHIGRVLNNVNSILLETSEPIQTELLLAAALAHDIGYLCRPDDHVRASAADSVGYLRECDFTPDEIAIIQAIILSHSPDVRLPHTLEEYILWVADKCDMLGFDGTMRVVMQSRSVYSNRDDLAQLVLDDAEKLTSELLDAPIGRSLITERWIETASFVNRVLARTPSSWREIC